MGFPIIEIIFGGGDAYIAKRQTGASDENITKNLFWTDFHKIWLSIEEPKPKYTSHSLFPSFYMKQKPTKRLSESWGVKLYERFMVLCALVTVEP